MAIFKESEWADKILDTKITSYEYTYKWKVRNFSTYISFQTEASSLESDVFYPEPDIWWKLKIQMEGDALWIYLYRRKNVNSVHFDLKLSVLDEKNKILHEQIKQDSFPKNTESKYYIFSQKILKEINQNNVSDTVTLVIYIKISKLETTTLFESPSGEQISKDVQQTFSEEMVKMYDNQLGTDITLKIQDETVVAHKAILSARSPVFATMFQQEMAESQSQVVDIPDIKMTTLKELLAFVYSGERRGYDLETALDVYYAADKYEVLKLKEVCSLILVSKLDSENTVKLLQLADRHSDPFLKDRALQFLRLYFVNCVESENWITFQTEKSELYKEVMKYLKKKI